MSQIEKGIVIEIETGARLKHNTSGSGQQNRDSQSTQHSGTTFGNMELGEGLASRYGSRSVQCQHQKNTSQQVEQAWNGMSSKASLQPYDITRRLLVWLALYKP